MGTVNAVERVANTQIVGRLQRDAGSAVGAVGHQRAIAREAQPGGERGSAEAQRRGLVEGGTVGVAARRIQRKAVGRLGGHVEVEREDAPVGRSVDASRFRLNRQVLLHRSPIHRRAKGQVQGTVRHILGTVRGVAFNQARQRRNGKADAVGLGKGRAAQGCPGGVVYFKLIHPAALKRRNRREGDGKPVIEGRSVFAGVLSRHMHVGRCQGDGTRHTHAARPIQADRPA